jgi:hypothetical protein
MQKNFSNISDEVSGEICSVLLRTVFCYNEAKAGLFATWKQFWDFSAKHFCSIHTNYLLQLIIFYCINAFIKAKAGLRGARWTLGGLWTRRISASDPPRDAQSRPNNKMEKMTKKTTTYVPIVSHRSQFHIFGQINTIFGVWL